MQQLRGFELPHIGESFPKVDALTHLATSNLIRLSSGDSLMIPALPGMVVEDKCFLSHDTELFSNCFPAWGTVNILSFFFFLTVIEDKCLGL